MINALTLTPPAFVSLHPASYEATQDAEKAM